PGGLILLDNILWSGAVADPDDTRETTEMIRAVTRTVHADTRVDTAILPIGDGLLMARLKA
ncbi:MAG: O-methyltransferase, partial [Hyphomicrobiaceae bacterium]